MRYRTRKLTTVAAQTFVGIGVNNYILFIGLHRVLSCREALADGCEYASRLSIGSSSARFADEPFSLGNTTAKAETICDTPMRMPAKS